MVGVSGLLLIVVGTKVSNKVEGEVNLEEILNEDVSNVEVVTFKVVNNVGVIIVVEIKCVDM